MFALLCLAAALPLAFLETMPLIDLGGHLGRYAIQLDNGATPVLRQWYSFQWDLLPNLGVDLLVQAFAPVLGLEPTVKLIVISIPLLQVAGWLLIARAAHGHIPPTALFALPLAYSQPLRYGFVNFALCTALASLALVLWIIMGRRDRPVLRWAVFALIACVLWVCHLAGWALFCVLAGAQELARRYGQTHDLKATVLRSILPLTALLVPQIVSFALMGGGGEHGATENFFDFNTKLAWLVVVFRDHWAVWDRLSAAMLLATIFLLWRSSHFRCDPGLALGAILSLGCFLVVPMTAMGSTYADMRLVPMTLAIALIAVRPDALCPRRTVIWFAVVGLAFAGARLAGNAVNLAQLDRQFTRSLSVLPAIPRDSQLVTLSVGPCLADVPWNDDRRLHLAGYAVARRHAFGNDQWIVPGGQLLKVHNPAAGRFSTQPSQDSFETSCGGKETVFDQVAAIPLTTRYLWVYGGTRRFRFAGWHPIRAAGDSVVYQRD
jgi:hypothetical protein